MRWAVVPVFAVTVAGCVCYLVLRNAPLEAKELDPTALKGKPAPEIALETLDNSGVKLSDQKGKVVVIDAWATWCPPCRESLPHLQKLSTNKQFKQDGLVVWAANMQEEKATIKEFMKQNGYTFTVLQDKAGAMGKAYYVSGIPATVIVGRDGTVKDAFIGYSGEESATQIDEAVSRALAEKP